MSNTLLTLDQITKEAQVILHQKMTFIPTIFRGYDDQFAKSGAKIGDTLRIRLPNEYTVRTTAVAQSQDTSEEKVDLKVSDIAGVDLVFTAQDMTLSIQDFSERVLAPAVARIASKLEQDALSMYKDVYQMYDQDGTAFTTTSVLGGRGILTNALAPVDNRNCILDPSNTNKLLDSMKTGFNPVADISKQNREGVLGRWGGMDFSESSLILPHLTGSAAKTTGYTVNGATQSGSTITIQTGTTTFLKGDVVTLAGCYRVHPETKATTTALQQFVVTEDSGANATSLKISPAIVVSGARQNVSDYPDDSGAIVKVGAGSNEYLQTNLVYQKNAFVFATADIEPIWNLEHSKQTYEGITMALHKYGDGTNFTNHCRLDVLYGYKTVRPQLAARLHADG